MSRQPICGDGLAAKFMTPEAQAVFQRFKSLKRPNASNATRHRIIDDLLREELGRDPALRVLVLGAGFDTRAFRLKGGDWLELDQLSILELKESALPSATAPNPLRRIGIDFEHGSLETAISAAWGDARPTVVVLEGVSMYLEQGQFAQTLATLKRLAPGHLLVCDLISSTFVNRYGRGLRKRIEKLGGHFAGTQSNPADFVVAQGYREERRISIAGRAAELGAPSLPRWLLNSLFKSLRDGYQIHTFRDLTA